MNNKVFSYAMKKPSLFVLLATLSSAQSGSIDAINKILPLTTTVYEEKGGNRTVQMVEVNTYLNGKETVDCFMYGDRDIANRTITLIPTITTKEVDKSEMNKLINECSSVLLNNLTNKLVDFGKDILHSLVIFPGTKWCGAGNVADGYEDLGRAEATDKCCRTHDHCNDSIPAFETRHNLTNNDFYTKSNCECDDEFQLCLGNINDLPSDSIGFIYFNFLQTQCFKNDYPQLRCLEEKGIPLIRESCQKYELDYNGTKTYQFFDAMFYEPKGNTTILEKIVSG